MKEAKKPTLALCLMPIIQMTPTRIVCIIPLTQHRNGHSIMKKIFLILSTLLSSTVYAEVFKCQLESGKTVYQSTPCQSAVKQQTIEIQKIDPREAAETEAKLKAWEEDFATREAARIKAEKELQAELDRKASVAALQKTAEYQRREAEALERQNMQSPYQQHYPYYPTYQSLPIYPSHIYRQHNIKEKTFTDTLQSERTELKTGKDNDNDSSRATIMFKWK